MNALLVSEHRGLHRNRGVTTIDGAGRMRPGTRLPFAAESAIVRRHATGGKTERMMRHLKAMATAVLLSAVMFNSCTCEKAVPPPPVTSMNATTPGFHASEPNKTPQQRVQAPTATPGQPQEVAAAATPTIAVEMPKDFPLPVFDGASLAQVQSLANDAHNVIFRSNASANDLYNFYQDKLTRDGWQVTQQFQRGNHAFLSFKKGDLVANVTIAEDVKSPGNQVLAVMYEHEKALDFDEF
jgi:hypothetical protein